PSIRVDSVQFTSSYLFSQFRQSVYDHFQKQWSLRQFCQVMRFSNSSQLYFPFLTESLLQVLCKLALAPLWNVDCFKVDEYVSMHAIAKEMGSAGKNKFVLWYARYFVNL